jgi:hypothetical protein
MRVGGTTEIAVSTWSVAVAIAITVASVSALAAPLAAEPDPAEGPGFVNLQRFDATSRVGLEFSITNQEKVRRWSLHAHYVDRTYHVGGYVRLPYTVDDWWEFDPPGWHRNSIVGNLAFGGLWSPPLPSDHLAIVVHAGMAIPVDIPEQQNSIASIAVLVRPHELYTTVYSATTIGAGASLLARRGPAFARVDVGFDTIARHRVDPLPVPRGPGIYANGGVGFDQGAVSAAVELSTLTITEGTFWFLNLSPGTRVLMASALSVRYRRPHVQAYAALAGLPSNSSATDYSLALTVGLEGTLR